VKTLQTNLPRRAASLQPWRRQLRGFVSRVYSYVAHHSHSHARERRLIVKLMNVGIIDALLAPTISTLERGDKRISS
jgi:hypothetical protein